jgi:hypothetical protein
MIRRLAASMLLLVAGSTFAADPIDIGSRLELFVDDFLIDRIEGDAELRVQRPQPQEVALVTDKPWEGNTSAYYTIFQDGDIYRMYYRGSHWDEKLKKATHREVTCYAESKDGIHWTKPELGLFEFEGSKQNNIVWEGIGTHCFAVFKDQNPDCEADARYKAISRGRPLGKRGLYTFKSPDGIRWSQSSDAPVITEGAFDSQNLAFWDPHTKAYREYHRTFVDGIRSIMTGTSKDFVTWTDPVLLDFGDAPKQHLYTNAVTPYLRAPHILIGFPTRYLPEQGSRVEPTFMSSRDGRHFRRWLDPVVPEDAPKDRGGNRSNYLAWGVVQTPADDQGLSVYATEAYYTGPDSRIRRFRYRVDGFVSVHASEKGAELVTKPLTFDGSALLVNCKTNPGGSMQIQLETPDGKPLASSRPFSGDATEHRVKWKSVKSLEPISGKPVQIRFILNSADLFSFRFDS